MFINTSDEVDTVSSIPLGYGFDDFFHCGNSNCTWEGQGYQLANTGECPVCLSKKHIFPGRCAKKFNFTHILSKTELEHLSKDELVSYINHINRLMENNSYKGPEVSDEDVEVEISLVQAKELLENKK